jgi:glutamine amidotransferase
VSVIGILSCGIGNARSIYNLLYRLGYEVKLCTEENSLNEISHLIIPGVGGFDAAITTLEERNLIAPIKEFIHEENPVLGICIGMQILFESSEEGIKSGLGIFKDKIRKLPQDSTLRIPNTAWLEISVKKENRIFDKDDENRYYHNHSYAYQAQSSSYTSATLASENEVVVGVNLENVFGIQFHPEKSHQNGHRILEKFCNI